MLCRGTDKPRQGTQDKEPRPWWARLSSLVPWLKIAGVRTERFPARAGTTSKRKFKKNNFRTKTVPELPALSQKLEQMARKKTGKWERKWENGKNGTTETDAAGLRDQAEIPRLRSG